MFKNKDIDFINRDELADYKSNQKGLYHITLPKKNSKSKTITFKPGNHYIVTLASSSVPTIKVPDKKLVLFFHNSTTEYRVNDPAYLVEVVSEAGEVVLNFEMTNYNNQKLPNIKTDCLIIQNYIDSTNNLFPTKYDEIKMLYLQNCIINPGNKMFGLFNQNLILKKSIIEITKQVKLKGRALTLIDTIFNYDGNKINLNYDQVTLIGSDMLIKSDHNTDLEVSPNPSHIVFQNLSLNNSRLIMPNKIYRGKEPNKMEGSSNFEIFGNREADNNVSLGLPEKLEKLKASILAIPEPKDVNYKL